ncbi:L30e-like protein, protein [Acrodontium crateriforme]|uniref:H/ACA ribonucleoprotein complex subunit 2 n=1 Tax=Acrodontium crateriforme TaxID=150365 RepID=A0AAQ3RBE2_9PEZI|nr:L30e-like protein, protein [Acrodontium crateriforme]
MAKSEAEIRERKEKKKDKKRRHSEVAEDEAVVEKKDKKKDKKRKSEAAADEDGDETMMTVATVNEDEEEDEEKKVAETVDDPLAALVPFANPLCDAKAQKKVLKGVKKAAKSKSLKRGVKECVKAIRKSGPATPASASKLPVGIVILAADISPMDVISHIPVLCEDHAIPYLYVPSRAELGAAGSTKRPTSVVMLTANPGGKDAKKDDEWEETYAELHKLALKLGQTVKV